MTFILCPCFWAMRVITGLIQLLWQICPRYSVSALLVPGTIIRIFAILIWSLFLNARGEVTLSGNIQWNGNVSSYLDAPAPVYFEGNIACRPGVKAIAMDVLPGFSAHSIIHLNDGIYGNGNSWIGNSTNSWAGLDLGFCTHLTAFAFGRDNTSSGLTDRTLGSYKIQYTQSSQVGSGSSWTDIGSITYSGSDLSLSRRHQFILSQELDATGFRIIAPSGACIDEIELYDANSPVLRSPWLTGGHFGQALSMGIRAPHWGEVRLDSDYQQRPLTVEAWVKLNSTVDYNIIVAAGFKQYAGCWLLGSDINTGNLFVVLPGNLPATVNTGQNIVDGQWHYVAMVLETARVRLYVDGVQTADAALLSSSLPAAGASPADQPGGLYIGAFPPDHQGCDGLIDEVRISNQILNVSGVPATAFQVDGSTIGLWHFDEFTNGGFNDCSTKANSAMLAPPAANPVLKLCRGITFDRLYFGVQSQPMFTPADLNLIKSMGFDHVKILIDPATHKSGSGIDLATMPTLKMNVDLAISSGLPVVVDIHPQADFKNAELGNPAEFENYLGFMNAFAQWLATNYPPNQIAFEFMTEPFGNYTDWTAMQYRIWEAVRAAMPNHTLILSGDQTGRLFGLLGLHPVNDSNVLYCFTTYDPFDFTLQGGSPFGDPIEYLKGVPYPSSPEIINSSLTNIIANVPAASTAAAQQSLLDYGEQAWNADILSGRFKRLSDWNNFFGGQLQLWCAEFGCLGTDRGTVKAADRYDFISDLRQAFLTNNIWWAYWSFNETFTVLLPTRTLLALTPSANWKDQKMLDSLGLYCTNCQGTLLTPSVAGYSSQIASIGRYATNTVNGSGMSGPGLASDTADNNSVNMWTAGGVYSGDHNPYITYDLGGNYGLQTTRIWQYNEAGFGQISAKTVVISVSADDVNFTAISTNVLNRAGGTTTEPAQDLATVASGVRYVKVQILNTWDGAVFWNGGVGPNGADSRYLTGFSEVRFVATAPVSTAATLTARFKGTNLNLSWPGDHLGWRLLVESNQGSVGLSTNWFTWPNSTNSTSVTIPVVPSNPSVFFKLVYP
jgi:endoglucanase